MTIQFQNFEPLHMSEFNLPSFPHYKNKINPSRFLAKRISRPRARIEISFLAEILVRRASPITLHTEFISTILATDLHRFYVHKTGYRPTQSLCPQYWVHTYTEFMSTILATLKYSNAGSEFPEFSSLVLGLI